MEDIKASMGEAELRRRSVMVSKRLMALPEYLAARSVMLYVSKAKEVYTHDLIRQAIADGKRVTAPVAVPVSRILELGVIDDYESDLAEGRYGVLEPRRPGIDPSTVDMFVVPGIAFDLHGNRLGSGWGYFDKLLGGLHGGQLKVGLAFDFQVVENLEKEDHDIAVDVVVSETSTNRVHTQWRKR